MLEAMRARLSLWPDIILSSTTICRVAIGVRCDGGRLNSAILPTHTAWRRSFNVIGQTE
jgi:hypothetical protein